MEIVKRRETTVTFPDGHQETAYVSGPIRGRVDTWQCWIMYHGAPIIIGTWAAPVDLEKGVRV